MSFVKKAVICLVSITIVLSVVCYAYETTDKYDDTIKSAFQLYLLMYQDCANKPYVENTDINIDVDTEDFGKCKAWEFAEDLSTPDKFNDSTSSFFDENVSAKAFHETMFLKLIDGKIVLLELGPQFIPFQYDESERTNIIAETDKTITLKRAILQINGNGDRSQVDYTFIINKSNMKICGGTFVENMLEIDADNPQTSDAPLIAVCAPALSALAAAVVLRKKRG